MAALLQLRHTDRAGATTLNLLNNTDGLNLRHDGWLQARAEQDEDGAWRPVDEMMTLKVTASDDNDLASKLQDLDRMLIKANRYRNRTSSRVDPVWLRVQLTGESNLRQALVVNGAARTDRGLFDVPVSNNGIIDRYNLVLTRLPFWEAASATNATQNYQDYGNISTVGGRARYSSIAGDEAGRLNTVAFSIALSAGAPSGPLTEIWMGFRSSQYGDHSKFLANWDLGSSNLNSSGLLVNNTSLVVDSTAYGSQLARWTPGGGADNNMLARVTARLDEIAVGSHAEQYGEFMVLLRAKVTSGGNRTFRARMLTGYYDGSTGSKWRVGQRVGIPASGVSAGSWYYYPLGIVSIPPDTTLTSYSMTESFSIQVQAEVASGTTGNLDLDTLTIIPIGEGGLHLDGTYVDKESNVNYYCFVTTSPDERTVAYNRSQTLAQFKSVQFDLYNWSVPTGEGRIIVAAQQAAVSDLTDYIQASFDYYARWVSLRGSDLS